MTNKPGTQMDEQKICEKTGESPCMCHLQEELTDKTVRNSDKIKVARVIADMLGVENAESMSPDAAINMGLRKIKNKRMTPELTKVLEKMIRLAQSLGVKVDMSLAPKGVFEDVVDPSKKNNIAKDIMRFKDFQRSSKMNKGIKEEVEDNEENKRNNVDTNPDDRDDVFKNNDSDMDAEYSGFPHETGRNLVAGNNDHLRRMKVKYHQSEETDVEGELIAEDQASADYKVNPQTGRKYRAHHIDFKNSPASIKPKVVGKPEEVEEQERYHEAIGRMLKEEDELEMSDADIDKMVDEIDDVDDIIDCYDDEELKLVDDETGEEVHEEGVNEEALNEVLSRAERMKARIRFARTASKRARRLRIALHRRSDAATISKRARRLAIKFMKEKIAKKKISQMTVTEKERAERAIASKGALINRIAMKMVPRIRRIENERMSHQKKD